MQVRAFRRQDEAAVIGLWEQCLLTRPWNDPHKDIERKLTVQPELFLVGLIDQRIVASVMAGYEGHRGWVNYLAVAPEHRRQGLARTLMQEVERRLVEQGCPKVSLMVRANNAEAVAFYARLGYVQDEVVILGKRLIAD